MIEIFVKYRNSELYGSTQLKLFFEKGKVITSNQIKSIIDSDIDITWKKIASRRSVKKFKSSFENGRKYSI